ncbi:MAG: PAS domain-containing protein, partial [Proteobacteria bacterium]|nr:PAS domain-containing protein [Pseudomonadota bacterium]
MTTKTSDFGEFPDINPAPVCRIGPDGTVDLANKAALRLFGGDGVLGMSWTEICPQMTMELWSAIRTSPSPVQHEADFGGSCILFTHVATARDDSVYAFGSDVTALRMAERRIAEKSVELAEVARFPEMNPGPVFRLDLEGVVLLANEAAKGIFGGSVVGLRWLDICPGMTIEAW